MLSDTSSGLSFSHRKCSRIALFALFLGSLCAVHAQDRNTEQGEAQITDPDTECNHYIYEPVVSQVSLYPTLWEPASILPNDNAAMTKWNSISSGVPNIAPKGSVNGSQTAFPTYNLSDPDCWWTFHQCTTPKLAGLPMDIASVPEPNTMGYGFDDGPNCSHNAFYDYLESQNQKATMYYIGSSVMIWPLEAQRALADGHEICVHTWSHRYMTAFSSEDAFAELWYTMQVIKLATGVTPTCWRPPYGDVDDRIRYIANALGLQTIIWGSDSFDWELGLAVGPNGRIITQQDVDNNYQSLVTNATNGMYDSQGAIMLTHELNNFTMSEAVKWYPQLQQAFKYMVPVGVAMNKTQPYVETNFLQPNFQQYISGVRAVNGSLTKGSSALSIHVTSSRSWVGIIVIVLLSSIWTL